MSTIEVYEQIIFELGNFYFKRNSLAYQYLIDAIYMVTKDKNVIRDFNSYVYPKIAKKYNTRSENVLWCLSKLLKVMYLNTDANVIRDYFGISYEENPSVKAFIIYVSYKVTKNISAETIDNSENLQYLL